MLKVAISYRVLQAWRVPVFERLAKLDDVDLRVFYGDDFEGTKVKSFSGSVGFSAVKVKSKRVSLRTSNGYAYIPISFGLYSELKLFSPDVIVVEGASNFINNFICFAYAKINKVAIIQWGLGEIDGRRRSFHRRILDLFFKWVERNSDAAISYSSFGAEYYKKIGISSERVFVAVNVVDTDARLEQFVRYCRVKGLPVPSPVPEVFNIVFAGSLSENKRVDILIHALSTLKDIDVTLTIIGEGPYRAGLENLASELGVKEKVCFTGHVNEEIAGFFYRASLFVLPGLGGLAVSDSLAHGVPVLCGIGDGCEKDLIIDGENGFIIPDMTAHDISENIRKLYFDPQRLASLRQAASGFNNGKYTISEYVKKIKEAVDRVAS